MEHSAEVQGQLKLCLEGKSELLRSPTMSVSVMRHCGKVTEKKDIQEERFILTQFQGLQPMVICCLWDCTVGQNTVLRGMWQSILAPLLVYRREGRRERGKDREEDEKRGGEQDEPLKSQVPNDPLPPTRPHPFRYDLINACKKSL